jgi:hypothetical protein
MKQRHMLHMLRHHLSRRAQECNAIAAQLKNSQDIQTTCKVIEQAGWAQGLLEAMAELERVIFSIDAANDNDQQGDYDNAS